MAFIWREREHEEQDSNASNDTSTIQALKNYGLLKFVWLHGMRQQMESLSYLAHAWFVWWASKLDTN